jgi:hypothetical protein
MYLRYLRYQPGWEEIPGRSQDDFTAQQTCGNTASPLSDAHTHPLSFIKHSSAIISWKYSLAGTSHLNRYSDC